MRLSVLEGKPNGHNFVEVPLSLTPKLMSVTPNQGSAGGSTIVATVPGVGVSSEGVDLVDSTGTSICSAVTVKAYGEVHCKTITGEIAGDLSVKQGTVVDTCASTDTTLCNYEQSLTYVLPVIGSLTSTSTEIVFTGTNFFTSGYTASATFNGVSAD
jgi:hypothetical protein